MSINDIKAIVAAAVASALSGAPADAIKLTTAAEAPVPTVTAKPKRKGNPEALKKWRESQKSAKPAEKPAKPAKVEAAPAVKAAPAPVGGRTFTGNGQSIAGFTGVNKTGKPYKGLRVTDKYGRSIVLDIAEYHALSCVIRSNADAEIRAFFKG